MKYFRVLATSVAFMTAAGVGMADRINVASDAGVDKSVERLVMAVEDAGARVFNQIDFGAGAKAIGEDLRPTKVVIFGSPRIGGKALQDGQTMALYLPLRILFFEDANGQTWATYDDPTAVAPSHGLAADHPAVLRMQDALERYAGIATGAAK